VSPFLLHRSGYRLRLLAVAILIASSTAACSPHNGNNSTAARPSAAPSARAAQVPALSTPAHAANGLPFHGFLCKTTCVGHERGYEWAEEHGIDDSHTCYSGPRLSDPANESFSEGCEAYVDDSTGAAPLDASERYFGSSSDDSDTNN
jgi:hypothetical protein